MKPWVLSALLSAFFWALSDALAKKSMQEEGTGVLQVLWLRFLIGAPVVFPILFWTGIPRWTAEFLRLHLLWIPLETVAIILYLTAIRISPLSLTLPYLALTPVFLTVTGRMLLQERVNALGFLGILLVVLGAFVLQSERPHPIAWLRAFFREKGPPLMVLVALIYAFTSIFGKQLIRETSPAYFTVHYMGMMALATAPLGLRDRHRGRPGRYLVLAGISTALSALFHMIAISQAIVAYMIALKRTSGVFGVLLGAWMFRERALRRRLTGASLMLVGAWVLSRL